MTFSIKLQPRPAGSVEELRASGSVPGVVYGPDRKSTSITIPNKELDKLYKEAGESTLIDLTIEGEKEAVKVLIQDLQFDPVKGNIIHVDFRQINMNEEMHATTELNFVGESAAVKELGGTLVKTLEYLNIKCLPKDLVSSIDVDLSALKTFDDAIHVKDITLPAGVTATDNVETVLAKVTAPLTEEQIKAMEESGPQTVEDVKVDEKVKKEGDEAAAEAPKADEKKK